jgi:hypothetical protein
MSECRREGGTRRLEMWVIAKGKREGIQHEQHQVWRGGDIVSGEGSLGVGQIFSRSTSVQVHAGSNLESTKA